ncbi:MAG: hypothetical protein LUH03_04835 [Oscillospiraceae bacterium]|nr:hypothetical protein [Oscillospiraceae bacterium]
MTHKIDVDILNRLLEHERFPHFCTQIRNYFEGEMTGGYMSRKSSRTRDSEVATAKAIQGIVSELPDKPMSEYTEEDITDAITNYAKATANLDDKTSSYLRNFVLFIFRRFGKKRQAED